MISRIEVDIKDAPPLSERGISWNGNFPYIPGTCGIKHYLYRSEFEKRFIDKNTFNGIAFNAIALGRKWSDVKYPPGYDDLKE